MKNRFISYALPFLFLVCAASAFGYKGYECVKPKVNYTIPMGGKSCFRTYDGNNTCVSMGCSGELVPVIVGGVCYESPSSSCIDSGPKNDYFPKNYMSCSDPNAPNICGCASYPYIPASLVRVDYTTCATP